MNDGLNKKLAEWAGFERGKGVKIFRKEGGTLYTQTNHWWLTPMVGGYRGEYERLPNFTKSLDACFTWLLAEAIKKFGEDAIEELLIEWAGNLIRYGRLGKEALHLCLAIDKLIGED